MRTRSSTAFSCRVLFVIAVLAAASLWPPEDAGAAEGPTVAVLNVKLVMRRSKAGTSLQDQIDRVHAANLAKDRKADEALRAEDAKLQAQRAVLSAEAFAQKRKELQSRLTGQQRQFNERRRRFQVSVNKAWFEIRAALIDVTDAIAAERKIDVVVTQVSTALMTKDLNIHPGGACAARPKAERGHPRDRRAVGRPRPSPDIDGDPRTP